MATITANFGDAASMTYGNRADAGTGLSELANTNAFSAGGNSDFAGRLGIKTTSAHIDSARPGFALRV